VPEDTSLDAFDSDGSDDADSAESASETDTSPATGSVSDTDGLGSDPAVSTFDWLPESGECADCGGSAERRWRADGERGGALVCADCKDW